MNKGLVIGLIIGGIAVAGIITVVVIKSKKKDDKKGKPTTATTPAPASKPSKTSKLKNWLKGAKDVADQTKTGKALAASVDTTIANI